MRSTKNRKIVLVLIVFICGLFYLVELFNPVTSPTGPTGPTPPKHRGGVAIGQCRQHVRAELLSPKSAHFASEEDFAITGKPANYHAITGKVEAQNVFGVVLESRFRCDLHYLPDKPEVWILDEFRLE